MRLTILPFPLLSLLLLLLPPPPSSLSLIPSHASPSPAPTSPPVNSTSCASYMCGSINISYPFYLSEALTIPSQYCGYPGMGVFCDHERTPILLTQNGNYTITHINYTNRIISLADTDVLNTPNVPCHRVRHNFTFFSNSTLNYTLSDTNLTFVFNCSLDTDPLFMVPCFSKKPLYSYVFPQDGPPKDYFKLVNRCEEAVVVPVLRKNLIPISPNALPTFYGPLLKDGFQLTWNNLENDYCNRCDKSGGRCGFNQTNGINWGSACFYQDGMHSGDRGDSSSANGGDTIGPSGANIPGITNSKSGTGRKKQHFVIAIAAVPTIFIIFMFFCLLWCRRRRKGNKNFLSEQSLANNLWESEERGSESLVFDFFQIANATNNFSAKNKLGQGGFGPVYKGQLPDGQEIAVKRLARNSGQGLVEFKNEILVIAKLQHINLVKLLGYSVRGEEKILIYEFMPNKSLDFFIFDQTQGALLDWPKRFHIIEGVAQGLLYLHKHSRLKIIHRDLKASNILLDGFINPKISDFGLARIFSSNEDQGNFTSKVAGTLGYISPEYAADGRFSIKSDVFSFGVLLLEIVSGKRNAGLHPYAYGDFHNLLGYAWEMWKEGRGLELVDPLLGIEYSMDQVMKCIHVALLCVQEKPSDRPTMSVVTTMLSTEGSTALADPMQPGFFNLGGRNEADEPSDVDEIYSLNRVSVTDPMVR